MKFFTGILILFIFFPNYAYSKEEDYYCVEKTVTGIEPTENYKVEKYIPIKFKIKIDTINNTFESNDLNMQYDNICLNMFTQEHVMQCNNDYGHIFAFNLNNNEYVFATLIGISEKNKGDSLIISYGDCEKF